MSNFVRSHSAFSTREHVPLTSLEEGIFVDIVHLPTSLLLSRNGPIRDRRNLIQSKTVVDVLVLISHQMKIVSVTVFWKEESIRSYDTHSNVNFIHRRPLNTEESSVLFSMIRAAVCKSYV